MNGLTRVDLFGQLQRFAVLFGGDNQFTQIFPNNLHGTVMKESREGIVMELYFPAAVVHGDAKRAVCNE
jgi:hypothetical protein